MSEAGAAEGFGWEAYVGWIAERAGSLAAAADRIAAARGHVEDVGTVERALRRLRGRGATAGGKWGERALRVFGLPDDISAKLRWMGAYHSRFTDLAVPLCEDLVRLWDRPPVSESAAARVWLDLARVTVLLRRHELDEAQRVLLRIRASGPGPPRRGARSRRARLPARPVDRPARVRAQPRRSARLARGRGAVPIRG